MYYAIIYIPYHIDRQRHYQYQKDLSDRRQLHRLQNLEVPEKKKKEMCQLIKHRKSYCN